ncbi:Hypothetical protein SCLAV_p1458 (plasmid) [Streptomyces clavuligerus]|uniref:Uncharacterized protein n=1 Tax=Streptomyces clavuligerus TaxID=1901 RepID=D5SLZ7_STRCL|nr:Hypothetical protein SCLAV_p1458 [Streptomyces clavuligerus]
MIHDAPSHDRARTAPREPGLPAERRHTDAGRRQG